MQFASARAYVHKSHFLFFAEFCLYAATLTKQNIPLSAPPPPPPSTNRYSAFSQVARLLVVRRRAPLAITRPRLLSLAARRSFRPADRCPIRRRPRARARAWPRRAPPPPPRLVFVVIWSGARLVDRAPFARSPHLQPNRERTRSLAVKYAAFYAQCYNRKPRWHLMLSSSRSRFLVCTFSFAFCDFDADSCFCMLRQSAVCRPHRAADDSIDRHVYHY